MEKESHFRISKQPIASLRDGLKDGVWPLVGIIVITGILVAIFALVIHLGKGMNPVAPIIPEAGEPIDPSPARLVLLFFTFVAAFIFGWLALKKGRDGKILPAFLLGYTGGTLLWQSVGECALHFSIVSGKYMTRLPDIEGASASMLVVLTVILLIYCYRRNAFDWGAWVFVLSFVGNWFGHFVLIGTYPLVGGLLEMQVWFKVAGLVIGLATVFTSLFLFFYSARSRQARQCCCLMLYFGIGILVTGVVGG